MGIRLLALAILVASAAVAALAIASILAARLLQVAIALSMVYVAYLGWRGGRVMHAALVTAGPDRDRLPRHDPPPRVSLVVAARDEAPVIGDVVRDLAAQRYGPPADPRLDVVVVDDASSDGTGEAARRAAAASPIPVRVIRREPARGMATKGAVLAHAHDYVRGDVVGALDADARVEPDFVARAMAAWDRDPAADALQVQRRALNAGASWLTAAQDEEQLMDMASQCGRWATDGTAELRGNGMFVRRRRLEACGGWPIGALTEDLDLSTRLGILGGHVTLAPEVTVREEAVERLGDLWRQRMRWAEGSLRRLMELGPRLVGGSLPVAMKLDFVSFAAEFALPPLFVAALVASLATIPLPIAADWTVPVSLFIGYGLGTFLLAAAGLAAHGVRGLELLGRSLRGSLFLSHWLLVVPAALLRIAFGPAPRGFAKTPRMDR
ncbi:MAG TPA: glycosyltransferase family 2 protein [Candidatus Limnocylindria bacterium]|nr:glycosyltransferase family 2 protein [Candidatus Limnocylindria bacterium]